MRKALSEDLTLQWATYQDASDQTSLSRIWGGIHPPIDDIPGRIIGDKIGKEAFALAKNYFEGIAPNDFLITTTSESCVDTNNGNIGIKALVSGDYTALLDGTTYTFTEFLLIDDLGPGSYTVCIYPSSDPDAQNCYTLIIAEMDELEISSSYEATASVTEKALKLKANKGTPPYSVAINGKYHKEFNNEVQLNVVEGDEITVSSALSCEGQFKMAVPFNNKLVTYPNPAIEVVNILLNAADEAPVPIAIYDISGRLLENGLLKATNNQLILPFEHFPPGVYFIKISSLGNKTIRVLKK